MSVSTSCPKVHPANKFDPFRIEAIPSSLELAAIQLANSLDPDFKLSWFGCDLEKWMFDTGYAPRDQFEGEDLRSWIERVWLRDPQSPLRIYFESRGVREKYQMNDMVLVATFELLNARDVGFDRVKAVCRASEGWGAAAADE